MMKKKRQQRDEHLRCVDERKTHRTGEMHLRCLGCGDELTLVLPCSLSMVPVVMREFAKEHRGCRQRFREHRAGLIEVLVQRAIRLASSDQNNSDG